MDYRSLSNLSHPSQRELRRAESATWGAKPEAAPVARKMRLVSWKSRVKNSRGR
jgi:hypothetical protein